MDAAILSFEKSATLPTTPQQVFEQADALLVHGLELKEDAAKLHTPTNVVNKRANTLIITAFALQAIADQYREAIQSTLDSTLLGCPDVVATYEREPQKAIRLNILKTRVEDGMASLEELEALIQDMREFGQRTRSQRSLAPEPETPPKEGTIASSCGGSQPEGQPGHAQKNTLKRTLSVAELNGSESNFSEVLKKAKSDDPSGFGDNGSNKVFLRNDHNYGTENDASDSTASSNGTTSSYYTGSPSQNISDQSVDGEVSLGKPAINDNRTSCWGFFMQEPIAPQYSQSPEQTTMPGPGFESLHLATLN